jgi:hypothetical protein
MSVWLLDSQCGVISALELLSKLSLHIYTCHYVCYYRLFGGCRTPIYTYFCVCYYWLFGGCLLACQASSNLFSFVHVFYYTCFVCFRPRDEVEYGYTDEYSMSAMLLSNLMMSLLLV